MFKRKVSVIAILFSIVIISGNACQKYEPEILSLNTSYTAGQEYCVTKDFSSGTLYLEGTITQGIGYVYFALIDPTGDTLYKNYYRNVDWNCETCYSNNNLNFDFKAKKGLYQLYFKSCYNNGHVDLSLHN